MQEKHVQLNNGVKLSFFYKDSLNEVCNENYATFIISEIYDNIKKFIEPDFLNGLTIEFYSNFLEITKEKMSFYDSASQTYKIASGLALYFSDSNKLIKINCPRPQYLSDSYKWYSDILSHEIGHIYEHYIGLTKVTSLYKLWNDIRGNYIAKFESIFEGFAEDFRFLFGSVPSKGSSRRNYQEPNEIKGLNDLMLIYKYYNKLTQGVKVKIERIDYRTNDIKYIGIYFLTYAIWDIFNLFPVYNYLDKNGHSIFSLGNWLNVKRF
jgi:hypothetical protein